MKRNSQNKYPSKTTVNLFYKKKSSISLLGAVCFVLIFGTALFFFTRYAVIERLSNAYNLLYRANEAEEALSSALISNADYAEVLREYRHYFFSVSEKESASYVDCQDVFELLEDELLYNARVQSVSFMGNVLTVQMADIDLRRVSAIAENLERNPLVDSVAVSTANKQMEGDNGSETVVYMNMVLKAEEEDSGIEQGV